MSFRTRVTCVCVCVCERTNVRVHAQEEGKVENFAICRSLVIMHRGLQECMSAFAGQHKCS